MSDPGLLVLSRSDIARLMAYEDYVVAVEAAFVSAAKGEAVAPPAAALHVPDGSFHAKGAALLGEGAVTAIKVNGNFPGNPATNGLPTVQGVIYLADGQNGRPLAVVDSIEVTINRTAAATTLAARHLARQDSRNRHHLWRGSARPHPAYRDRRRRAAGAGQCLGRQDGGGRASRPRDVVGAEARYPRHRRPVGDPRERHHRHLHIGAQRFPDARPGETWDVHLGGGRRQAPTSRRFLLLFMRQALPSWNSLEQAAEIGDLHHALAAGAVTKDHVDATLGEILAGAKPGRRDPSAITLFDSTGMGLQDVAAAAAIYRRALASGAGTRLSLT